MMINPNRVINEYERVAIEVEKSFEMLKAHKRYTPRTNPFITYGVPAYSPEWHDYFGIQDSYRTFEEANYA